jgi:hypothetical protein
VGKFLALPENGDSFVQVVKDGRRLTAKRLLQNNNNNNNEDGTNLTLTKPMIVHDTPQSIGMQVLEFPRQRQVTVRDIADTIGHYYPINVIDVEHQEELGGWTLADFVDYFEDEERLLHQHQQEASNINANASSQPATSRRRRKAAEKCISQTTKRPRVLNQISLEFSKTALNEHIASPQFVRDLDWIDHAWPSRNNSNNNNDNDAVYPNVQYYCLTSAGGCFTDFHLDFGGTAVWYHILSGEKVFLLIPPSKENLAIYEHWLCRPDQAAVFLPDLIPNPNENVIRISLKASQTLVIPTAWIHAVYTPTDSVVLGGNFLHGLDMALQLEVHCIESRTRVQEKFRFPFFLPLNFYAGGMYLNKLRQGTVCQREVDGLPTLMDALDQWWKVQTPRGASQLQTGPTVVSAAEECAKRNNCATVEEFLTELRKEHERAVQHGISPNPSFVSQQPSSLAPPSKPKLKLRLPKSSVVPPAPTVASFSSGGADKFRIVVSSSKWNAAPPPTKLKRRREDTEWIDDGPAIDDEWMPSTSSSKPKKRNSDTTVKPPRPNKDKVLPKQAKPAPAPKLRPVKSSTSSRQRLLKRFR